ncbi:ABC transporter permease [Haploplasma modicum]|jgi:spermidine/putrescine transport system permease protein|uniref:ABC transporter permease n=1 Tax=Haploplasma modicum TaxID=2150 RepID=UPI00214CC0AA|nr:ABC transporter permease [Haploplasma modicum]MCR1808748.1 ABC transporter permease [Haploplasma modicum]
MKKTNRLIENIYFIIIILFTYIPMASMIIFSFNKSKSLTKWTGFSLEWYVKLFQDRDIIEAITNTITVAVISTVVATIIGTLVSIALTKHKKLFKETILGLSNIPILSPEIVTAIAFFVFFGAFAIQKGMTTMILAHIAFSTPYVILAVYPKVKSLDKDLVNAAYDLGATPRQALFKVILPQIKVAIFAGAAIAFAMSFDDFVISYFASGGMVKNISIYLYTLKRGIEPTVNALSAIIMIGVGIKVAFDYIKSGKENEE